MTTRGKPLHLLTKMGMWLTLGWALPQPLTISTGTWEPWQLIVPTAALFCAIAGILFNGTCRFGGHTWKVMVAQGSYEGWVRDALEKCPPIGCEHCDTKTQSRAELAGDVVLIYPAHWDSDFAERVAAQAAAKQEASK